jgi:predicted DCC family thiol-disulfide oxidoreductase YuxK
MIDTERVSGREGETVQRPALVYDGDCAFCTRSAAVARRVLPADCAVVPWQGADLASVGTTAERAQQEVLWVPRTGDVVGGARAVAAALCAAGSGWALLGRLLQLPPGPGAGRPGLPGGGGQPDAAARGDGGLRAPRRVRTTGPARPPDASALVPRAPPRPDGGAGQSAEHRGA